MHVQGKLVISLTKNVAFLLAIKGGFVASFLVIGLCRYVVQSYLTLFVCSAVTSFLNMCRKRRFVFRTLLVKFVSDLVFHILVVADTS